MMDELKRADERVKNAEARVAVIEDELQALGENQKQLEVSEEKARRREEKYQDQIKQINIRLKQLVRTRSSWRCPRRRPGGGRRSTKTRSSRSTSDSSKLKHALNTLR